MNFLDTRAQQELAVAIAGGSDEATAQRCVAAARALPVHATHDPRRRLMDGLDLCLTGRVKPPVMVGWLIAGPEHIEHDAFASLVAALRNRSTPTARLLHAYWDAGQVDEVDALVADLLRRRFQPGLWALEDALAAA